MLSKCPPGVWLLKLAHPNVNCMQNWLSLPKSLPPSLFTSLCPSLSQPKPMRAADVKSDAAFAVIKCALYPLIFLKPRHKYKHTQTRADTHTHTHEYTHTQLEHEANKCREHEGFIKIKYLPRRVSWVREQGKERERERAEAKAATARTAAAAHHKIAEKVLHSNFFRVLFPLPLPALLSHARSFSLFGCVWWVVWRVLYTRLCAC